MTEAELAEAVRKMGDLLAMMAAHFWWDRMFTFATVAAGLGIGYALGRNR